ncbi:MAG: methanogenesis marker 6 protein [Methanomicrobiales archaeon]|jgi:putative methanogenesis marker protein 6|nr:methanogenesis marker 6 protein [Methanomicrobiales archaeon]
MADYEPEYRGSVTKYVFVESPDMTPGDLAIRAYEIAGGVMIKETCFGIQVTGSESEVEDLVSRIRSFDPTHIFVKDRGFPPGDPRRCRANLGGARPGFFGHEFEMGIIRHISRGLLRLPSRDPGIEPHPPTPDHTGRLDSARLKAIIAAKEP